MDRKVLFLAAACWLAPAFAHADPRGDLLHAFGQCAAMTDAPQRLACYDRLAPQLRAMNQAPANVASAPQPPTKEERRSRFGFDYVFGGGENKPQTTPQQFGEERVEKSPRQLAEAKKEEVNSITARVMRFKQSMDRKFVVYLDNGQVWEQLPSDSGVAHFSRPPRASTVTIARAILGSYSMTVSDNSSLFKVKRIK
jgi:hypothetical protein